jgi:Transcriptional regulatory protein, C terminal
MIDEEYIRLKREEVNNGHKLGHAEGLCLLQMLESEIKPTVERRIKVDEISGALYVDGKKIARGIPFRMSMILKCLAERSPRFQNRDQLIDYAYGEHFALEDRSVDGHMKHLRRILPEDSPVHIVTRYGIGYALLFKDDSDVTPQRLYSAVLKSPLLR